MREGYEVVINKTKYCYNSGDKEEWSGWKYRMRVVGKGVNEVREGSLEKVFEGVPGDIKPLDLLDLETKHHRSDFPKKEKELAYLRSPFFYTRRGYRGDKKVKAVWMDLLSDAELKKAKTHLENIIKERDLKKRN